MFLNGRGGEVKGCLRGCRTFQPRILGKQSPTFRATLLRIGIHLHSSCFLLSRGDWETDWALQIIADRECLLSLDVWTNASDGLHLQIVSNANLIPTLHLWAKARGSDLFHQSVKISLLFVKVGAQTGKKSRLGRRT
jgi:hypothetical protein